MLSDNQETRPDFFLSLSEPLSLHHLRFTFLAFFLPSLLPSWLFFSCPSDTCPSRCVSLFLCFSETLTIRAICRMCPSFFFSTMSSSSGPRAAARKPSQRVSPSLPSIFLPGEPVLPLRSSSEKSASLEEDGEEPSGGGGEEGQAVRRLAEINEEFEFTSSAYIAAHEAMTASKGELQCTVPCTYIPRLPQYPYSPGYLSTGQSRYQPVKGDIVVGIVSGKRDEEYTVSTKKVKKATRHSNHLHLYMHPHTRLLRRRLKPTRLSSL